MAGTLQRRAIAYIHTDSEKKVNILVLQCTSVLHCKQPMYVVMSFFGHIQLHVTIH